MRLLITGVSGMLGHSLMRLASEQHEAWGLYRAFPVSFPRGRTFSLDLLDGAQVRKWTTLVKPDAIVHTAAFTDVDGCQQDPLTAEQVNVQATKNLALVARDLGINFVYISTDYVFDGSRGNYVETDAPGPVNVYGETKLLGEEAVRSCCPGGLIIRTSIFGFNVQHKLGAVEQVIQSLERGKPMTRFLDQFSSPIYTGDLSRLVLELLERGCTGLFHVGGGERISRYSFAIKIADVFCFPREMVSPVAFKQLQGMASRPRDSSLCGKKVESALGTKLPKIEEGLERLKADMEIYERSKEEQ